MPRLTVPSIGGGRKVIWTWPGLVAGFTSSCACSGRASASAQRRGRSSRIVVPVQVREDVVTPLAVFEKSFVDRAGLQLLVKPREAQDVVARLFGGVVFRGPGLHQEGPVAGLGQQELAGELLHAAVEQRAGRALGKLV